MNKPITAAKVADLLGVTPNRVHKLAAERDAAIPGDRIEMLRLLPQPVVSAPYRAWDEREVIRCRAYREGGQMAERAERTFAHLYGLGSEAQAGNIAAILQYPEDDDFGDWVTIQRDLEGAL